MPNRLSIKKPLNLIQEIRLVHALTESEFEICIPPDELPKFGILQERFAVPLSGDTSDAFDISEFVDISHKEPLTSIGALSRPLLMPHAVVGYCRSIWAHERSFRYSLRGLVTQKRRELIRHWVQRNIGVQTAILTDRLNIISRLRRKILLKAGVHEDGPIEVGDLLLWSSARGRTFPIKAWDDRYFRILANSQFVLCPSGDYVWSYRFFEAVLCGAIPIVDGISRAYEGFRFHSFEDAATDLRWSIEDAELNYRVCLKRLTVPGDALNLELRRISEGGS